MQWLHFYASLVVDEREMMVLLKKVERLSVIENREPESRDTFPLFLVNLGIQLACGATVYVPGCKPKVGFSI